MCNAQNTRGPKRASRFVHRALCLRPAITVQCRHTTLSQEGELGNGITCPSFTGLVAHSDRRYNYRRDLSRSGDDNGPVEHGVFYAPILDDEFTGFSAEGCDLGMTVTGDDLAVLKSGFLSGLRKMPNSTIESQEADAIGTLITMEARHTYRDGGVIRKRWVRLLYQGSIQVRLVAQGATVTAFDYWLPMFYESMRTFRFGDWGSELTGEA
jgi:hypothetical protein